MDPSLISALELGTALSPCVEHQCSPWPNQGVWELTRFKTLIDIIAHGRVLAHEAKNWDLRQRIVRACQQADITLPNVANPPL